MLNIEKLKKLRQDSGVSFSLCKKALEKVDNDMEKAKELLTSWGAEKIIEKSTHTALQGGIFSYIHHNKKIASLIELFCETDFVAGNQDFQKLGQELAMQVASMRAGNVEELLNQEYIRDPSKKVNDLLKEAVLKFGENIKVGRFLRWQLGEARYNAVLGETAS